MPGSQLSAQARVIGIGFEILLVQPLSDVFGFLARETVDNAGIIGMLTLEEFLQLLFAIVFQGNAIANIWAIEACEKLLGLFQLQATDNLIPRACVCSCRECDARHLRK